MKTDTGMVGEMPISVGAGLGFGIVVMVYVLTMGYAKRKQDKRGIFIVIILRCFQYGFQPAGSLGICLRRAAQNYRA